MRIERITAQDAATLGAAGVARRLRASVTGSSTVATTVQEIVEAVRTRGDEALTELTRSLDSPQARPLRVQPAELDAAIQTLPLDVVAGLQVTIANVAEVAHAGVADDRVVVLPQGQRVVVRELPVQRAAVYVPGGRAPYPSTVAMGVVAARSAGVSDVAVCSPPGADGEIDGAILGTCRLCGVETVYRMGGAQAIAALALGTETVDRVDVIVGPGNLYVQEAKRQLSGVVGIDGFAGPSDLVVLLAGDTVLEPVALDLLAQAEHGAGSAVVALSPSQQQLDALQERMQAIAAQQPEAMQSRLADVPCALVNAPDAATALEICNEFAPEHLQLIGEEAEKLAPRVRAAGCLFVGPESATAFGDYVAGSNHILPTGGAARFSSGVGPGHFRRRMAEVRIGPAAAKLAAAGAPIARQEGFELHARSMEARAATLGEAVRH